MAVQISGNDITVPRDTTVTRNLTVGGVLTYEDVTNVDSVGIVTARGLNIFGNTSGLSATGVSTFAGNVLPSSDSSIDIGTNAVRFQNIYADTLYGDGSNLTGITQTTINNNAAQRVVTGSASANTVDAEPNLTYDGGTLQLATDANMEGIKIISSGNTYNDLTISANRSGSNNHIGRIVGQWNGGNAASIVFNTGGDTSSKDDGEILFSTSNGGSSLSTRMKIRQDGTVTFYNSIHGGDNKPIYLGASNDLSLFHDSGGASIIRYNHNVGGLHFRNNSNADQMIIDSSGRVMIGTSSAGLATGDEFVISTTGHTGMTIRSGTSGEGNIFFGDSDYGAAGIVRYDHSQNAMIFKTNAQGTDKFRINSNGDVTTTGASSFVRSNAGFTARAGDSVQITRASGTPLEISRTGNNGQMINIFRDTTGVAQIGWDGSYLTLGTWSDTDVFKVGSSIHATKKLNVDFTVSGSDYVAYFRNSNANSYGVSIQEPSSVNTGYPLLSISNSSGGSHFRVDTNGLVYANSGAGTDKKAYFVRAWVNFDGQGGSAGQNRSIQDSQNVTSVYDNDAGDFTINFTTNMPHSAYVICGMAANWEATNSDSYMITSAYKNATNLGSCRVRTIRARFDQHPPQFRDSNENMIAIIC